MKRQNIDHTQLLVLSLLAGEDMYGYQMIVELARRSDHTFEMKEGTLYPVLHGLERQGMVEAYEQGGAHRPPAQILSSDPERGRLSPGGGGGLAAVCRSSERGAAVAAPAWSDGAFTGKGGAP